MLFSAELLDEVEGYKPQYEELENLNKLIQNEVIFNNPYCKHTMESLNVSWEELHNCKCLTDIYFLNLHICLMSHGIYGSYFMEWNCLGPSFGHFFAFQVIFPTLTKNNGPVPP